MTNKTVSSETFELGKIDCNIDTTLKVDTTRATFWQRLIFLLAWLVKGKATIPWGPKND